MLVKGLEQMNRILEKLNWHPDEPKTVGVFPVQFASPADMVIYKQSVSVINRNNT
jgi:hypothetical protein